MTQREHRKSKAKMYEHCAYCGRPKTIPQHIARKPTAPRARARKASTYVDRAIYEQDPYCSRTCCEADLAAKANDEEAA
jgi:hypothetical protein